MHLTQSTLYTAREITQLHFHSQQQTPPNSEQNSIESGAGRVSRFLRFANCSVRELLFLLFRTVPHWRPPSLVRVLGGGQQQCVDPGHLRVRLSHSAIHGCLVFLPASPPRSASSFSLSELRLFKALLPDSFCPLSSRCSPPPWENKQKTRLKNSLHLLLSELLTMQIPSLSSSALPSHCLLFPPSLSATVGEVLSTFLSFSSLSFDLPLTVIESPIAERDRRSERGARQRWESRVCLDLRSKTVVCYC